MNNRNMWRSRVLQAGGGSEDRAPWGDLVEQRLGSSSSARVAAQGSKGIESQPSLGQRAPRLRRPQSPPTTSVYESQSAAGTASARTARLHVTQRQPRVAERGHAHVHVHGRLQRRGGTRQEGWRGGGQAPGPIEPRRSDVKENPGRKSGSRDREGGEMEKPGQKHRRKHVKSIREHRDTPGWRQKEAAC